MDWIGRKAEDMTHEQLVQAVKDLRKGQMENEPVSDKPPLGCKPSWVSSCERIEELSEAIIRNVNGAVTKDVNGVHKDTSNVKKWATEILYQCEIMEKC